MTNSSRKLEVLFLETATLDAFGYRRSLMNPRYSGMIIRGSRRRQNYKGRITAIILGLIALGLAVLLGNSGCRRGELPPLVPEDYPADEMTPECGALWEEYIVGEENGKPFDPTVFAREHPECSRAAEWKYEAWRGCVHLANSDFQEEECGRKVADRSFWLADHPGWQ